MPIEYKSFGLGDLFENEELVEKYIAHSVQEGRMIYGYEGNYILKSYGKTDFLVSVVKEEGEDGKERFAFKDLNLTANGKCIWKVKVNDIDFSKLSGFALDRYCLFSSEAGNGALPVHVLDSDVIPSYFPGEVMEMQITAISVGDVNYYENEDEYTEAVRQNKHDMIPAIGSIIPAGFLAGGESEDKAISLITGTVKSAYYGTFKIDVNSEPILPYLIIRIDTEYGELDLIHSFDQMSEDESKKIVEGAVVRGLFVLTGDVGINEYENGFICDPEHNLKALHYSIYSKNFKRLEAIVSEGVTYSRDDNDTCVAGKKEVIEYLQWVADEMKSSAYPWIATITEAPEGDVFSIGDNCIVIAYDEEDHYENLLKVLFNEDGKINEIKSVRMTQCRFRVERTEKHELPCPDDPRVESAVFSRATMRGFINDENIDKAEFIDRANDISDDERAVIVDYINTADISRLQNDKAYRESFFSTYFKSVIGNRMYEFDKDDQELIEEESGKFGLDYHFRTDFLKEDNHREIIEAVLRMEKAIAKEMLQQNYKNNGEYNAKMSAVCTLISEEEYMQASKILKEMVVMKPLSSEAWNYLAFCYSINRENDLAYRAYRRAYALNQNWKSLIGMILSAEETDNFDKAQEYRKEFKEKFPDKNLEEIIGTQEINNRLFFY